MPPEATGSAGDRGRQVGDGDSCLGYCGAEAFAVNQGACLLCSAPWLLQAYGRAALREHV